MIALFRGLGVLIPALLRFGIVGLAGFVIDAGVLALLLTTSVFGPISARLISFPMAVLATFELNRRWTFRDAQDQYIKQLVKYLAVQSLGFLSNLVIYTSLLFALPGPYNLPLLCVAFASGGALLVNFAGAYFAVFRRSRPAASAVFSKE